jgi:hypothetical protein
MSASEALRSFANLSSNRTQQRNRQAYPSRSLSNLRLRNVARVNPSGCQFCDDWTDLNNTGTCHAEQPHHTGMEGKQVLGERSLQSDVMVDLTP